MDLEFPLKKTLLRNKKGSKGKKENEKVLGVFFFSFLSFLTLLCNKNYYCVVSLLVQKLVLLNLIRLGLVYIILKRG